MLKNGIKIAENVFDEKKSARSLGHNFSGEPTWQWQENHQKALAIFACQNEGCQETLTIDAEVNIMYDDATCRKEGSITYLAKVELNGKIYRAEFNEVIAKKPHEYPEPIWSWSKDLKSAIAIFECDNCGNQVEIEAKITQEAIEDGKMRYTVHVTFEGIDYENSIDARYNKKFNGTTAFIFATIAFTGIIMGAIIVFKIRSSIPYQK